MARAVPEARREARREPMAVPWVVRLEAARRRGRCGWSGHRQYALRVVRRGSGGAGSVATPFNGGGNFAGNSGNGMNNFGSVAGFNAFSGVNPGFNGGVNPTFGNTSGQNTNFAFNPFNGFNPLLGNPAGINGFSGSPLGTNALTSNPFNAFNGQGSAQFFGSNPLINNLAGTPGANNTLGSNALTLNPVSAVAPGQVNNLTNNPLLFNPAGNVGFSGNPNILGTGTPFANGLPVNGTNLTSVPNSNGFIPFSPITANTGFGNAYAGYGAGYNNVVMTPFGVYSPYGLGYGVGYGGYGPGYGMGYGLGYGGYGGLGYTIGLSPYDQSMIKSQRYGLNASRYNLNNARATKAYAAANFYNDLAAATVASSYKTSTGIKPTYSISTGGAKLSPQVRQEMAAHARAEMIPREKLIDKNGHVLWPESMPTSSPEMAREKADVDAAVGVVAHEYATDGRASVRDVATAQEKLRDFGTKAIKELRSDKPAEAAGMAAFLGSLEYAMTTMADSVRTIAADHTRPDNSPKTGGDVLKDTLKPDKTDDANKQPAKPDTAPKTGGDVLKDGLKRESSR